MKRLLIAGANSGCGKTTVTCALLAALHRRGLTPVAFKCGPDYLDTMFHRAVFGVKAYNLDPFFLDGEGLRSHLAAHAGQISIIEGAMGYYDGIAASDEASAYTVARETATPVVLVLNAHGVGYSLTALLKGLAQFRPHSHIAGVIFNNAPAARYADLARMAQDAGLPAYGTLPQQQKWALPSRHLGLLTAGEIEDLQDKLRSLSKQAEQSIDIDGLLALANTAPDLNCAVKPAKPRLATRLRLAIARDEAFCFLYEENLELWQALGCELLFFSPLTDAHLPSNIQGLYLGGGYPENHAAALAKNTSMLKSIRQAVGNSLPTIAEGGGFLYLHKTLDGFPLCGVIDSAAFATAKLQRFGYITITAAHSNLLCATGGALRAHEFHYWDSDSPGSAFTAKKAGRDLTYPCVQATDTLYAGFPHLYFPANPASAERFVERMARYEG